MIIPFVMNITTYYTGLYVLTFIKLIFIKLIFIKLIFIKLIFIKLINSFIECFTSNVGEI